MQTHHREVYGHFPTVWTAKKQDKSAHRTLHLVTDASLPLLKSIHSYLEHLCAAIWSLGVSLKLHLGGRLMWIGAQVSCQHLQAVRRGSPRHSTLTDLPSSLCPQNQRIQKCPCLNTNSFDRQESLKIKIWQQRLVSVGFKSMHI